MSRLADSDPARVEFGSLRLCAQHANSPAQHEQVDEHEKERQIPDEEGEAHPHTQARTLFLEFEIVWVHRAPDEVDDPIV